MAICSQGAGPRSAGSSLTSIVRGPRAAAPFRARSRSLVAVPPGFAGPPGFAVPPDFGGPPDFAGPPRAALAFLTAVPPLAPFLAAPGLSTSLSSGPGVAGTA